MRGQLLNVHVRASRAAARGRGCLSGIASAKLKYVRAIHLLMRRLRPSMIHRKDTPKKNAQPETVITVGEVAMKALRELMIASLAVAVESG